MSQAIVFAVCFVATTLGSMCGLGGGIIIKPVVETMNVMGVSQLSLLSSATVLAMAVVSVIKSRKRLMDDLRTSTLIAIGAVTGGILGKQLFGTLRAVLASDALIGAVQAVLTGLMALTVLVSLTPLWRVRRLSIQNPALTALAGLMLGMVSAFLGIGGGPFNLLVLGMLFSMDTKRASLNSVYVILFSQSAGIVTAALGGLPDIDPMMLTVMVSAGVLGGFVGSRLNRVADERLMNAVLKWTMALIVAICAYNAVRYALAI